MILQAGAIKKLIKRWFTLPHEHFTTFKTLSITISFKMLKIGLNSLNLGFLLFINIFLYKSVLSFKFRLF